MPRLGVHVPGGCGCRYTQINWMFVLGSLLPLHYRDSGNKALGKSEMVNMLQASRGKIGIRMKAWGRMSCDSVEVP